ncbi:hypothetical protein ANO11243_064390 [Dothideomycetidae sp. 11243]|nr:hypothetical protein ANO11243_064390 [fungal sp. No.11243]
MVHTAIICAASPFFKAALESNSNWLEGLSNTIALPEDDPVIFTAFLKRLYSSHIESLRDASFDRDQRVEVLFKLYFFANKIQAIQCGKAIIIAIHERLSLIKQISMDLCAALELNTQDEDELKVLVIDWFMIYGMEGQPES